MELNEQTRTRLIKDEAFRAGLLADPRTTLVRELDTVGKPAARVQVHENSPSQLHLVIPDGQTADGNVSAPLSRILVRAQSDADFAARLQDHPCATLSAELGVNLPTTIHIVVHRDGPDLVHIVLPAHEQAGVTSGVSWVDMASSTGWGCKPEDVTPIEPCTLAGNKFCTATRGCKTVHGGDPDCVVKKD